MTMILSEHERLNQLAAEATARETDLRRQRESRPAGEERWYVTLIGARSDDQAINRLIRCEFEYYRPMMRKVVPVPLRQLSKKQRAHPALRYAPKLTPLLGKYLFVRFDLRRPDWGEVFEQAGIWGIQALRDAARPLPAAIGDKVIAEIKAREVDGAIPSETLVRQFAYEIGEMVRVSDPERFMYGHTVPIEDIIPRELLTKRQLADLDGDDAVALTCVLFNRTNRVLLPLSAIAKI